MTFKDVSSPEKLNEEENDQKGFVITMFDGEAKQLGMFKLEDVQKMFKDHKIYAVKLGASCSSTQQTCDVGVFFAVIKKLAKREKAVPEDKTMAELIHNSLKRATIKRKRTQNGKLVQVKDKLPLHIVSSIHNKKPLCAILYLKNALVIALERYFKMFIYTV